MLDHKLVLNTILSYSCSNPANYPADEWNQYDIDLHCEHLTIIARPLGDNDYEIKSLCKRVYITEDKYEQPMPEII